MRLLYPLAATLSLASLASAQFEGWEPGPVVPGIGPIPATWTSVNNSVGGPGLVPNWQVRNDSAVFPAFSGTTYAWANYNSATGVNNISNYLISPAVTLNNGDTISFYTRTVPSPLYPDRMELVFNTTGSTLPADFTNVLLTVNPTMTTAGYPNVWTQFSATISGLSGPTTGRYAFHYNPTAGGPSGANSDYIGIDDVLYTPVGGGTFATATNYGTGCYQRYGSFYEYFATSGAFDLSNTSFTMVPATGGGYTVIPNVMTYVAPSASATVLGLGDDTETPVTLTSAFPYAGGTTTSLTVCSNGFVSVATGNGTGYDPDEPTTLNAPQTGWWAQHDMNPSIATSGKVKFEQIGAIAYITFDGVYDYLGTTAANASTFQFQFDTATGFVSFVFGTMSANGNARLVGYSPGGSSADPLSMDLSVALGAGGFSLPNGDVSPLALAASARPITGTSISLDTTNVTGLSVGINFLSTVQFPAPGFDLTVIGAPGCAALVDIGAGVGNAINNIFPGGLSAPLSIPNNPALSGVALFSQSAWLDATANTFGALTSNGVALTIGTF